MTSAIAMFLALTLMPAPQIGNLALPLEYWAYTLQAAGETGVDPCIIWGVLAIESRGDPAATSGRGRCIGLMQLDRDTAKFLGVDPWNPRENIHGGARVLARLLKKYQGDLRLAVRAYNGTGNRAYEREVLRAVAQARRRYEEGRR
ncbi:MAG: lytic transglycosylase domain-containing protein [Deltaproteobacteria bacterium]|nr:lytic transglycosylase domain-containing protein [Deltaproteobacteria bacterium]